MKKPRFHNRVILSNEWMHGRAYFLRSYDYHANYTKWWRPKRQNNSDAIMVYVQKLMLGNSVKEPDPSVPQMLTVLVNNQP